MLQSKRGIILVLAMLAAFALMAGCSSKDAKSSREDADYPKRAVTIIVPFTAGGGADLMARALATPLEKELGKPFVVTAKPGGSGAIGMAELAHSKPDGYTLILTSIGPATLAPNNNNVGYSNKEFTPVAQVADIPTVACVHKDSPYKTFNELLAAAEKDPGKLTYGTAGAGLIHNVALEGMLMGVDKRGVFKHVPFNGGMEAVTALLGKHTDFCVAIAQEVVPYVQSGELRALAISSGERYHMLPDVPTFKEVGYKLEVGVWYGFAAPAGTPAAIIQKLEAALKKAAADPQVAQTFQKINQPIVFLDSKAFTEKWMRDFDSNKKILAELNKK